MKITRLNDIEEEDDQQMLSISYEMRNTVVGRLKKMLVLELENGDEVVYPEGTIVEVSSEKEYCHNYDVEKVYEAFSFANRDKGMPDPLTGEIEN